VQNAPTQVNAAPIPAAEYVRRSTDHQRYSIENQQEANRAYAEKRGMVVVRTYTDDGKSGLSIVWRDALKKLVADVQTGRADFKAILVYDVTRWGRFQDTDESAYYEYICRSAGVAVHYCAEPFENDGSSFSSVVKGLKRAMAAEYSRELSARVFAAKSRVVGLGYRVGGQAGYALRRMLIDERDVPRGKLKRGERKVLSTDRVILVPGPSKEVKTVRWIFSAFVHKGKTESQIANILNRRGVTNSQGREWNRHGIKSLLRNEKYVGNNVWNRTSFKLHKDLVCNTPEKWLRARDAFAPIIDKSLFEAAQAIYRNRITHPIIGCRPRYSDDEMLERLKQLLKRRGYLSKAVIDNGKGIQSASAYEARFGCLTQAYSLIGYTAENRKRKRIRQHKTPGLSDEEMLEKLRELLRVRGNLSKRIIDETGTVPSCSVYVRRFGSMKQAYRLIGFTPDPWRKRSPRPRGLTDEALLDALRRLWRDRGHLSQSIVYTDKSAPSCSAYQTRFGGFLPAYELIGFVPKRRRHSRKSRD
jgi:DNA invertase Pin-like site-specific DNA recombinase